MRGQARRRFNHSIRPIRNNRGESASKKGPDTALTAFFCSSFVNQRSIGSGRLLLGNELHNLGNQLGWNDHDGLPFGLQRRFVFRDLLVFRLVVVVFGEFSHSFFIPARWVSLLFFLGHLFFLRWRRRNASLALGVRSYAVTTNALSLPSAGV